MGLFDSLLNVGKKALNDAATKEIADKLDDTLGSVMKGISSAASGLDSDTFGKEAASNLGLDITATQVSPDELEQEHGQTIYKRGGCLQLYA